MKNHSLMKNMKSSKLGEKLPRIYPESNLEQKRL